MSKTVYFLAISGALLIGMTTNILVVLGIIMLFVANDLANKL